MKPRDTFTPVQKDTFCRIQDLEKELTEVIDPSLSILNSRVMEIQAEIDSLQEQCDHVFENGVCVVCGVTEK